MRTTLLVLLIATVVAASSASAQTLEQRVESLEHKVIQLASAAQVLFLYGGFCALWAQRTGRNAWLWFFLGLLFGPITLAVLLHKNAQERPASTS